ncbi:MAG: alpha/beta fold hydrolase [Vicinamibacterales bacterium]
MFDQGQGAPLIVIPGVQGRWEWMKPTLDELAKHGRAVSYTLCGDIGSDMPFDPALGFDNFVQQLDHVFDRLVINRAALCGVSYGGFIALRYAAVRPERVTSLVLVSSPAPGWAPNPRQQQYLERPWLSAPAFVLTSPLRLWPEIKAAYDTTHERLAFSFLHALRVFMAPIVPPRMATRVALQQGQDFVPDCARITAPTLIVTGEDDLDQIVPPEVTRHYRQLIRGAQYVQMKRSGHIGLLTHPAQFAGIVSGFINANGH